MVSIAGAAANARDRDRSPGYRLMVGGDAAIVERIDPILRTLAPGVAAAPRTPGRDGAETTAERGLCLSMDGTAAKAIAEQLKNAEITA